jgi:hypothetical protein
MVVPLPGAELTSSSPPRARKRSAIPCKSADDHRGVDEDVRSPAALVLTKRLATGMKCKRLLAVAVLVGVLMLGLPGIAFAHAGFVSGSPEPGSEAQRCASTGADT